MNAIMKKCEADGIDEMMKITKNMKHMQNHKIKKLMNMTEININIDHKLRMMTMKKIMKIKKPMKMMKMMK